MVFSSGIPEPVEDRGKVERRACHLGGEDGKGIDRAGENAAILKQRHEESERVTAAGGDGVLTDGLWGDEMAEERGKHDQDHGVGNPGQVLKRHIALELPVYPLISCKIRKPTHAQIEEQRNEDLHTVDLQTIQTRIRCGVIIPLACYLGGS